MRVHHLALRVENLARSEAFYGGVLGLSLARRVGERALWLNLGEGVLMLERELLPPGADHGSGHVLSLAVDDLMAWEARLEAAGVAVVARTDATLFVHDPDGHRVGLSAFRLP